MNKQINASIFADGHTMPRSVAYFVLLIGLRFYNFTAYLSQLWIKYPRIDDREKAPLVSSASVVTPIPLPRITDESRM